MILKYLLTTKFDENIEVTKIGFLSHKRTKLLLHNKVHALLGMHESICEFVCQLPIYGSQCYCCRVIICESQKQKLSLAIILLTPFSNDDCCAWLVRREVVYWESQKCI